MRTRVLLTFIATILVALSMNSLSYAATSSAAPAGDITISPTQESLTIEANQTYTRSITVVNSGTTPLTIKTYATPYGVKNEQYEPILTKETARTQINRWVTFAAPTHVIAANQTVDIPYTITTPASIPDGGQYAAIFVESINEDKAIIVAQKRVGMKLFARASGTAIETNTATFPALPGFTVRSALDISGKATNTGNVDQGINYRARVTTLFGTVIFDETHELALLPDTTRLATSTWRDIPPIGAYTIDRTLNIGGKSYSSSVHIIVLSSFGVILLSIIGITLILGVWYGVARRRKSAHSSHK